MHSDSPSSLSWLSDHVAHRKGGEKPDTDAPPSSPPPPPPSAESAQHDDAEPPREPAPCDDADERSFIVRFFDSFLQEQNIKWVLGVGTLILFGSSLMLVVANWQATQPVTKYLIMFGYTIGIAAAAQFAYHKLALRKTGTILMALTVLLLPVLFLALHWIPVRAAAAMTATDILSLSGPAVIRLTLLAATMVFAAIAARPIFRHFLHGDQWLFVGAYLLLCVAGPIAPLVPTLVAPIGALALWLVFATGAITVNRHVFWLTESHRAPRIVGFFPTLLLAGQFLVIYTLNFAPHVPVDWLGFGLALIAIPTLLAADEWAKVFQRRAKELATAARFITSGASSASAAPPAHPFPAAIILPMVVGLGLCLAGLILAATQVVPPHVPYAMSPTALLVAVMMVVAARRTNRQPFVWAALLAATLLYEFSPAFFQQVAAHVKQTAADVVNEERLPLAFYGLTNLPLIAALMALAVWLRRKALTSVGQAFSLPSDGANVGSGDVAAPDGTISWQTNSLHNGFTNWQLFAGPVKLYAVILSIGLLLVSTMHAKAMMPVAAAMIAVFAAQTFLFRRRAIAMGALAALLLAAGGVAPFLAVTTNLAVPASLPLICFTVAAALLLAPGVVIDRKLDALPASNDPRRLCETTSLVLTLGLGVWWHAQFAALWAAPGFNLTAALLAGVIAALLLVHTARRRMPMLTVATLAFTYLASIVTAVSMHVPTAAILNGVVIALLAQWCVAALADRRLGLARKQLPGSDGVRAWVSQLTFAQPAHLFAAVLLGIVAVFVMLPQLISETIAQPLDIEATLLWPCRAVLAGWLFAAAFRYRNPLPSGVGCIVTTALAGAAFMTLAGPTGWQWLPTVYASTALAALPVAQWLRHRSRRWLLEQRDVDRVNPWRTLLRPIDATTLLILGSTAAASLLVFTAPMRIAGGVALAGLLVIAVLRDKPIVRTISLVMVNLQLLALTVLLFGPAELTSVLSLELSHLLPLSLPVALVAAASVLVWQRLPRGAGKLTHDIASAHRTAMRAFALAGLAWSLGHTQVTWNFALMAGAAFAMLAVSELWAACRTQHEHRAWFGEAIVAAAVGWFSYHGVIHMTHGVGMFSVLGVAVLTGVAARIASAHNVTNVLARPFNQTAFVLPAVTVGLAVGRHLTEAPAAWLGVNSLALLLAAGFYFWRGVELKERRLVAVAAGILNVALILLWRELQWTDPQFYLVPVGMTVVALTRLLRDDIPAQMREPLYYAGALIILVSPTFHIVSGSWLHLFTLMALSVAVILVSIGVRLRPLVFTGSAFLVADLVAMIVRGSVDHPSLLWISGIALGAAVITIGAIAERNRELILQRLRKVSAVLETWE